MSNEDSLLPYAMNASFIYRVLDWLGMKMRRMSRGEAQCHAVGMAGESARMAFSVMVCGGDEQSRSATILSLLRQTYTNWEALISVPDVGGGDFSSLDDGRFQPLPPSADADGLSAVLQTRVRGDWLVVLGPGSELAEDALFVLWQVLARHPEVSAFYADSALTDPSGRVTGFHLCPAWSPDYFDAVPYPDGLVGVRVNAVRLWQECIAGNVVPWFFPLFRQLGRTPGAVCHVAEVLLLQPETHDPPWPGWESRIAYLRNLDGVGSGLQVEPGRLPGSIRVTYPLPVPPPLVEIVIPTHNGGDMLRRCLESVFQKTEYPAFQVAVIDNRTSDTYTLALLEEVAARPGVRLIRYDHSFNFSAINNLAVSTSNAELVCLLNDDVEIITPGWLNEMVSHAYRSEVGAVGARLLYPDGQVQHAGVVVGMRRSAGHANKGATREDSGYMGRLQVVQNCTAVTGACLVVSKEKYLEVGGMDEQGLKVAYNDVDFCLKLRQAGYLNIWTPHAELFHHESATRGGDVTRAKRRRLKREAALMDARWGVRTFQDPYYHPALTLKCEDFSVADKPWPLSTRRRMLCR